jgi:hypothetical protein
VRAKVVIHDKEKRLSTVRLKCGHGAKQCALQIGGMRARERRAGLIFQAEEATLNSGSVSRLIGIGTISYRLPDARA